MPDLYVVISHVARWDTFFMSQESLGGVERLTFSAPDNSIGFIPVYASRQDAQRAVDRHGAPAQIVVLKQGLVSQMSEGRSES